MATRKQAGLKSGTTLTDYASGSRIEKAFGGSMKDIRAEYSRQRSIIRKRVERMESAGETYNKFYGIFGDRSVIPSAKGLTDAQVLKHLSMTAQAIGGGYVSTVSEIRERREELRERMLEQAEEYGDEELAEALKKPLTPRQYGRIGRVMGMIRHAIGQYVGSDEVFQEATKVVLQDDGKTSLLTLANKVMNNTMGEENVTVEQLSAMKERYTAKGTTRVSYAKAHRKRGN